MVCKDSLQTKKSMELPPRARKISARISSYALANEGRARSGYELMDSDAVGHGMRSQGITKRSSKSCDLVGKGRSDKFPKI